MSEKLTERMEVRLTKDQKQRVEATAKKYEKSEGHIIRLGLEKLFSSKIELPPRKG